MTKGTGVAVIGAGHWGKKLVSEYLRAERNDGLRLVKVCDQSLAALGGLLITRETSSVGESRLTQNVSDVLQDPEISAVNIATPNPTHYSIAKMALEAGKNVLVEKPMTLNSRQSYELVDLAKSRGLVIQVGHVFRFDSALRLAQEILNRGELGQLFYIRIQWTDMAYFPDRDIIFDLGPHPVDILNQFLDAWPERLNGIIRGFRAERGEVAYIIAEFPNDVFAHIELSWLHPDKVREVTLVGSNATLTIDCINQRVLKSNHESIEELPVSPSNTIASEIFTFIDSVKRNDTSSKSGLIGAHTVEVLESIRSSMWNGPLPIERLKLSSNENVFDVLKSMSEKKVSSAQIAGDPQLEHHVHVLLKSGLVRCSTGREDLHYEITDKGLDFLMSYQEITLNPNEATASVKVTQKESRKNEF